MNRQPVNADGVPATSGKELRRVVSASVVGTALEWYDFFIYGTAVALVFNDLFFPAFDPAVGTLVGFATFGVAFLVRPLGGFLFGHLGDRIGRRTTLVITTLVMGLSTGLIGLLPTYDTLGVAAPILLVLMRVCQGLGAGAEFGGASTLLAEHAPAHRRGFFTSFAQTGVQIGLLSGTLVFLLVGLLPESTLLGWAWRVPFLLSFALIAVSLYVRLRVAESPVFRDMSARQHVVKLPIVDALRRNPRNFLVGIGAHVCDTAVIYIYATFTIAYIQETLGLDRWVALTGVIAFTTVQILLQPVYGALSDRIGRRPLNLFSVVFTAAFAFPFFLLLDTREPVLIWLALVVATAGGIAPMIAVQPAFYSELFGARVRYTGFAASREIGAALAGFSPMIATALLAQAGGRPWLVAGWMILTALVSLVAFLYSRESRHVDITLADATRPASRARTGAAAEG
ncbi:MFS transporter [Prauserella muralis]|uniref:Putative proline/betaine transporter n=1 Tax=Prauserella muralis TaxID=588067 RepID=A0A2V4B1M4_9PSEU|nr:MFS transporter [Prauserella muralis]PXY28104.1 MFS transporter [Prauserella muralis]TWE22095.1 nitrate/nitrite transporter NarK [Prauserella muralis]